MEISGIKLRGKERNLDFTGSIFRKSRNFLTTKLFDYTVACSLHRIELGLVSRGFASESNTFTCCKRITDE